MMRNVAYGSVILLCVLTASCLPAGEPEVEHELCVIEGELPEIDAELPAFSKPSPLAIKDAVQSLYFILAVVLFGLLAFFLGKAWFFDPSVTRFKFRRKPHVKLSKEGTTENDPQEDGRYIID